MNDLTLTEAQVRRLEHALCITGWTADDIATLSNPDMMANLHAVIQRRADVRPFTHVITDDGPKDIMPGEGLTIHENRPFEEFVWHPSRVWLFRSARQYGGTMDGTKLYRECRDKPVLNANVLEYLLEHRHLIPEDWRDKTVLFMGTILKDRHGNLAAPYLRWDPKVTWTFSGWYRSRHWLARDLPENAVVALLGV